MIGLIVFDANGRDIGRICKPRAGVPPDHPWRAGTIAALLPDVFQRQFAEAFGIALARPGTLDDLAGDGGVDAAVPC